MADEQRAVAYEGGEELNNYPTKKLAILVLRTFYTAVLVLVVVP